ncbi:MAG TPA: ABC transporter permease subunit [Thermoanaerobaculia bacterium]
MTDAAILFFTVRMAALATALLIPPALALAWLLARPQWRGKSIVETLVALPLVMPPVATGLILLKLVPHSVVFTWRAVVIAMMVMSSPFIVRAARIAFENVNPRYEQIARTLGAHEPRVFFTITLPLALRGISGGVVLGFARALGEFGATILVAGNIPGRTTTLAVAIYDRVQLGRDDAAWHLVAAGVFVAFIAIWLSERSTRRRT